jgi:hypothetical protein
VLVNLIFGCGPFACGYDRSERNAVMTAAGGQGTRQSLALLAFMMMEGAPAVRSEMPVHAQAFWACKFMDGVNYGGSVTL